MRVLLVLLLGLEVTAAANMPLSAAGVPWPGGARADLVVPDSLWQRLLPLVHRGPRPLGYTADEMAGFGRDALVLRPVKNLFRDVPSIPRFSGKVAEDLVANAADPADMVQRAFALTDVSAGRMLPMPDSTGWGVDWLPPGTAPAAALEAVLVHAGGDQRVHGPGGQIDGSAGTVPAADRRAFSRLPEPVQRLVVRIVIGAAEATPWIRAAYDAPAFADMNLPAGAAPAGASKRLAPRAARPKAAAMDTAAVSARYRLALAPWTDARMDQSATLSRSAIEALSQLDREYLEFGTVIFLTHFQRALKEFRRIEAVDQRAAMDSLRDFAGCRFDTPFGPVHIYGPGVDDIKEPAFLTLDLGGDDRYLGRHGVPFSLAQPIGLVVDLGGNDTYDGGPGPVSLGCGLFGLGAVFDLGGDDHYRIAEAGLGAGYFGVGILVDYAGDDAYTIDTHDGQGTALAGVGLLIDLAGNDAYTCGFSAQGFGETLGAGLLVDVKGNDTYLARDDGNISALYLGQSVSMAQGVGQGRRADLGDGHSLAGGIGFLVDGAGDDSYHATAWSQGAGYWWSAGFLEDLGGNDQYRNGKYSLGAAAHFAVGCQVDLSGDDRYNVGNSKAVNQYQGHARDGSIGISIDGDGNDEYYFRNNCGGSGDLNATGLFWDRRGDDIYHVRYELLGPANGWSDTPPMGTATVYAPFRSFRDDIDAIGVFLDTGGSDRYQWQDSIVTSAADAGASAPGAGSGPTASGSRNDHAVRHPADNQEWPTRRGANSWGYGLDAEVYPARDK